MQTTTAPLTLDALDLLIQMAEARPNLDPRDYISDWRDTNGRQAYNRERAEITRDLNDFRELVRLACSVLYRDDLNSRLIHYLMNTGNRLHLNGSKLGYHVGQYYPTEYRPACSRALVSVLWRWVNETRPDVHPRDFFRSRLGARSRVFRNYFN